MDDSKEKKGNSTKPDIVEAWRETLKTIPLLDERRQPKLLLSCFALVG
jgi:hypothetical protein